MRGVLGEVIQLWLINLGLQISCERLLDSRTVLMSRPSDSLAAVVFPTPGKVVGGKHIEV